MSENIARSYRGQRVDAARVDRDQHANELAERVNTLSCLARGPTNTSPTLHWRISCSLASRHAVTVATCWRASYGVEDSDTLLAKTIEAMERLFPELNARSVLEKLDKFIRVRQKTIAIEKALLELEVGQRRKRRGDVVAITQCRSGARRLVRSVG